MLVSTSSSDVAGMSRVRVVSESAALLGWAV